MKKLINGLKSLELLKGEQTCYFDSLRVKILKSITFELSKGGWAGSMPLVLKAISASMTQERSWLIAQRYSSANVISRRMRSQGGISCTSAKQWGRGMLQSNINKPLPHAYSLFILTMYNLSFWGLHVIWYVI